MSEAKHTSGPWATRFIYRMIRRVRESPGDLLIASSPENDWADARLMAASPDLLETCQFALDLARSMPPATLGQIDWSGYVADRLADAVAKATREAY